MVGGVAGGDVGEAGLDAHPDERHQLRGSSTPGAARTGRRRAGDRVFSYGSCRVRLRHVHRHVDVVAVRRERAFEDRRVEARVAGVEDHVRVARERASSATDSSIEASTWAASIAIAARRCSSPSRRRPSPCSRSMSATVMCSYASRSTRWPRTPSRPRLNPPRGLACLQGSRLRPVSPNAGCASAGAIAIARSMTLLDSPSISSGPLTGPGNLGNAPRCLHRFGRVRPDERWDVAGSSGNPAFVPLAMPRRTERDVRIAKGGDVSSEPLPVTGAWQPADPIGCRQFLTFANDHPVRGRERRRAPRRDDRLRDVGHAQRAIARTRCSSATRGRATAMPPAAPGQVTTRRAGGTTSSARGLHIDTDRWFVVCANVLGGCQGSTGPASPHPDDGRPYGSRFPVVTIRDMVRAPGAPDAASRHRVVARGRRRLDGRDAGARVGDHVSAIGCARSCRSRRACRPRAQQIAWGAIGRRAIRLDPRWRGGDYYDAEPGDGPSEGLAVRPSGRPGHVPQRQRVHRSLRARPRRPARVRRHVRPVAAVRGRALPRTTTATSWCAASTPTATSSSARRWICTTSPASRGSVESAMARITVPST